MCYIGYTKGIADNCGANSGGWWRNQQRKQSGTCEMCLATQATRSVQVSHIEIKLLGLAKSVRPADRGERWWDAVSRRWPKTMHATAHKSGPSETEQKHELMNSPTASRKASPSRISVASENPTVDDRRSHFRDLAIAQTRKSRKLALSA